MSDRDASQDSVAALPHTWPAEALPSRAGAMLPVTPASSVCTPDKHAPGSQPQVPAALLSDPLLTSVAMKVLGTSR